MCSSDLIGILLEDLFPDAAFLVAPEADTEAVAAATAWVSHYCGYTGAQPVYFDRMRLLELESPRQKKMPARSGLSRRRCIVPTFAPESRRSSTPFTQTSRRSSPHWRAPIRYSTSTLRWHSKCTIGRLILLGFGCCGIESIGRNGCRSRRETSLDILPRRLLHSTKVHTTP